MNKFQMIEIIKNMLSDHYGIKISNHLSQSERTYLQYLIKNLSTEYAKNYK